MFERISAGDNSKVKLIKRLRHKKHRDRDAMFIAEGANMIEAAIDRGAEIEFILADDGELSTSEIEVLDSKSGGIVAPTDHRLFESLSDAGHGVSLMAVVRKPVITDEDIDYAMGDLNNVLILDEVQDPGNFGTLIRTAAAAGYTAVLASRGTVDAYSPKVLRATAGTIFDIPVLYFDSPETISDFVHSYGKRLVVAAPS
jgi:TrmH family RNA methyltransferase